MSEEKRCRYCETTENLKEDYYNVPDDEVVYICEYCEEERA